MTLLLIYLIPILPIWIIATVIAAYGHAEIHGDDIAAGALVAFLWPGSILIICIYAAATIIKERTD